MNKGKMDFASKKVEEACKDYVGFEYDVVKSDNVHYIYWRTESKEYVAAFSDIESRDSGTYDIRVFRIWQRCCDDRRGAWALECKDYLFGASMDCPLAMFIDYLEDYDAVECAFPMNEWHFNTLIGNFNK